MAAVFFCCSGLKSQTERETLRKILRASSISTCSRRAIDLHRMKVTSQGSALLWVMAMSGGEWRPTCLTPGQLEERRLAAATLLRQGQMTQAAIARHLGVSRASVCRWAAVL